MNKKDSLINKAFVRLRLEDTDLPKKKISLPFTKSPIITVARDPGSGGKPIAQKLAKKLGYKFYDDRLIEEIANSAKQRKSVIKSLDEDTRGIIDNLVQSLLAPEKMSHDTYLKHLTNTVLSIASKGKAVILGRGSNFIAPSYEGLHVYVTAPMKVRIQRAIRYEKIDSSEARERIKKITNERKQFVSNSFGKAYDNPDYYDVILNTQYFSIEGASEVIIKCFKQKFKVNGGR